MCVCVCVCVCVFVCVYCMFVSVCVLCVLDVCSVLGVGCVVCSERVWCVDHLEKSSSIRCDQGIDDVVLASGQEPLPAVGKLEGKHAGVMATNTVLLRFVDVEHLHQTVLHST